MPEDGKARKKVRLSWGTERILGHHAARRGREGLLDESHQGLEKTWARDCSTEDREGPALGPEGCGTKQVGYSGAWSPQASDAH